MKSQPVNQPWKVLNSRLVAVSSRHHPVLADQGASTEVVARVQRHLVGLGVLLTLIPSDDLVVLNCNCSHLGQKG